MVGNIWQHDRPKKYILKLSNTRLTRHLAVTETRLLCLISHDTQVGDFLCIIKGTPLPFAPRQRQRHPVLIDSCYIHGMMDGQVLESDRYEASEIELR
jgi:hypothetical protein